eukprot:TRINITY_DN1461_c0_g1_i2.p1 TRINITY_DN1461_c0_g1~~TRINITY_DN1461_c0_g1_i2.p1  ORF type:complete len:333 (+),score=32.31 TRINITY_DN1461_c0_g1_i2:1184-2182(+)
MAPKRMMMLSCANGCGEVFSSKQKRAAHEKTCSTYKCFYCGVGCEDRDAKKQHQKECSREPGSFNVCESCGETFKYSRGLSAHICNGISHCRHCDREIEALAAKNHEEACVLKGLVEEWSLRGKRPIAARAALEIIFRRSQMRPLLELDGGGYGSIYGVPEDRDSSYLTNRQRYRVVPDLQREIDSCSSGPLTCEELEDIVKAAAVVVKRFDDLEVQRLRSDKVYFAGQLRELIKRSDTYSRRRELDSNKHAYAIRLEDWQDGMVERQDFGSPNIPCHYCGALLYRSEAKPVNGVDGAFSGGVKCCIDGRLPTHNTAWLVTQGLLFLSWHRC